ncbi:type II toxin-antitoxin system Phd/YefM family antitoxin [Luteimonas sp. FCS-9]|uniref:type II toxin-antitoxin system Phd/YefM family antitoxin n=1 Tax=Luteimonas sp. FCS-9 TaxID=1547516 RepID=UPI00063EC085|nr:type II toxin-antitoxin system Phd/YefM family antitoxin [Luteimonas sp. FCS-9]KLI98865.1 hypothetical protein WQ56_14095 [Luteimonas sp. FCS-9]
MKTWQVQEAKARFSELLRVTVEDGPQIVSHGRPTAVVVPMEQWQRLQQRPRSLKALLQAPDGPDGVILPRRGRLRRHDPEALD